MLETAAAARYQQVQTSTASKGDLLLALYDGMFRFLNGARLCLERGERSRASEQLSRTHAILSELYLALDHHAAPELCRNLAGVYGFSMDRITQAMAQGDVQSVDDAIRVLSPLREAWKVAVPEAARELGLRKR